MVTSSGRDWLFDAGLCDIWCKVTELVADWSSGIKVAGDWLEDLVVSEDGLDLFEVVVGWLIDVWLENSWSGFVGFSIKCPYKNLAGFLLIGD